MSDTRQLLIEASKEDVVKHILDLASNCHYKNWSNMNTLLHISNTYCFVNKPYELTFLKEALTDAWSKKANDTSCKPNVKARAIEVRDKVDDVLKSRPVGLIIEENVAKQSEAFARNRLTTHITDQICVPSASTPSPATVAEKRRKKIMPKDFKGLSDFEKADLLVDICGTDNILDLRQSLIIPQRLQAVTSKVTEKLNLLLSPKLKTEEYSILKKISEAKIMKDYIETVEFINIVESKDELVFIKMLVNKIVILYKSGQLMKEHNESWYRVNVYSDAFDLLFLTSILFESKRAECESVIVKTLKELKQLPEEQKNCRLDFILESSSNDRFFEQLFCEDKPKEKKSESDIEKADLVRSSSLKYWSTLLPYKECLYYIESISCHFNKLTLRVYGTRLIDGRLIHYVKKETSIPNNSSGPQLADYITTVLSLFRQVILNLKKIKTMCEIALQDDIIFLKNTTTLNTFREDSPDLGSQSSQSRESSVDSSTTNQWEIQERKERILDKIQTAIKNLMETEDEEYIKACWEDLKFFQE